jgi:hypothetical protein
MDASASLTVEHCRPRPHSIARIVTAPAAPEPYPDQRRAWYGVGVFALMLLVMFGNAGISTCLDTIKRDLHSMIPRFGIGRGLRAQRGCRRCPSRAWSIRSAAD